MLSTNIIIHGNLKGSYYMENKSEVAHHIKNYTSTSSVFSLSAKRRYTSSALYLALTTSVIRDMSIMIILMRTKRISLEFRHTL